MTLIQPSRRKLLVYVGLGVLSFGATYGVLMFQGRAPALNFPGFSPIGRTSANDSPALRPDVNTGTAGTLSDNQLSRTGLSSADTPMSVVTAERTQAASAAEEAGRDVISAASADEREEAMVRLESMSARLQNGGEPELLQALEVAATVATDWEIRYSAVNALARAVSKMPDNLRVVAILQNAAHDPQQAVAIRAKAALDDLRKH
jgi:hypothetical protein